MNVKNFIGALAIATAGVFATGTASIAATQDITDGDGDAVAAAPFNGGATLTLDAGATGTLGTFDSTSSRFTFEGSGSADETFNVASAAPVLFTFGTLTLPEDFDKAEITVDGTVIDLIANPGVSALVAVASPFTVVMDIVANKANGQFDFTISAIPLPAGLALLLGGLGILGWVGRRRQAVAA